VFVDDLPATRVAELVRALKARQHAPRVVLMSMEDAALYHTAMTTLDVDGVVNKHKLTVEVRALFAALTKESSHVESIRRWV
jgi:hypothetical protein